MNIPNWLRKVLGLPDPTLVHPDIADLQAQLAAANATAAANRTHAIDATRRLEASVPADVHMAVVAAAAPPVQPPVLNSAGTWTIGAGNAVLLNNAPAAGGLGTRIKKVRADTIVVLGTDGNWWEWTGSGYINVGPNEPVSPGADASSANTATASPPTATAAANGAGNVTSVDVQPLPTGEAMQPLRGEQLVRMMVEQAAGYDDPILRAELGSMRGPYVDAYETGAGAMGADIGKLRTAAVYPSWHVLMQGASNPTSAKNVAAVQVLLDQGAIKAGGSLDGFAGV